MSDSFDNTGLMGRAWFKPMVGAWFALLLGGGLWLMPPHVHGLIARSTGLATLHPMFALPVSQAGVAVICGAVALFGLFLGIAVAGRVAAATAPRAFAPGFEMHDETIWQDVDVAASDDFEEPRRRRVFSAREDIGEEGIAISAAEGEPERERTIAVEDIPPATPEEDFEAVYAGLEGDYLPPEERAEPEILYEDEDLAEEEPEPTGEYAVEVEEAEFEPWVDHEELPAENAEEEPEAFAPAYAAPEDFQQEAEDQPPMGDASLETLLGRLETALEHHKKMVAGSVQAAERPAPQPIPMMREPFAADIAEDDEGPQSDAEEDDPVIAFLRREASRRMPDAPASPGQEEQGPSAESQAAQNEAQAALRSALDRLGQVNRRD